MKKLSKIALSLCLIVSGIILLACEESTRLRCATFSEITAAGSKNFGVRINYLTDKRLDGKYTDIQIKFDNIGEITIWKENQAKITYEIEETDEWQSLTTIFAAAEDKAGEEKFEKFEDALTKTILFNYTGKVTITMRVVVGDVEDNSAGTGQILVGSESISDNFDLKLK